MASPAESPLKASNISEFVHKVAQAYKRRPSSAKQWEQRVLEDSSFTDGMASEGSMSSNGMATPSRNRSTEEVDFTGQKCTAVTSSPALSISTTPLADPSLLAVKVRVMETLVTSIFSTISALRSSYTELQAAHNPHDPVRLEIADKAVIAEFRRFSELKESYLERNAIVSGQSLDSSAVSVAVSPTNAILKSNSGIISNFNAEIQKKNVEAEDLKDMLAESTLRREKLERRVKRLEQKLCAANGSAVEAPFAIADLLQAAVQRASEVSKTFTKLLVSLMKAAEWDLDAASDSIEPGIIYVRRSHRKYAFESYVCQQMWNGFENADFYVFGSLSSILDPEKHRRECYDEFLDMKTMDPLELVSVNPDCLFAKFCQKKFLQLVHSKMETSFFGNFEHRNQITEGGHPNSQFYHSFLRLAKAVWLVHRLAFAFNPTASIFQAKRGTDFTSVCMESVVPLADQTDEHSLTPPLKVGFSVMPGFRVEKGVIRCQVYLQD